MAQDPVKLVADKNLEKDLLAAQTPDEIRDLLHQSIARSPQLGIERDEQTGRVVSRRDPLTPAAQTVEEEAREFSKTVKIGGRDFTFTDSSEDGLTNQIASAQLVAEKLQDERSSVTPRSARKAQDDAALEAVRQAELSLAFKRGELSTADYLRESGALAQALRESGVDVEKIAGDQFQQSWTEATDIFLRETPEGQSWKGGQKNLSIIGNLIEAAGLTEASDKVAALRTMAAKMRAEGLEFEGDVSEEQLARELEGMTPQEILEQWKEAHAGQDPTQANASFIETFRGGRISGSGIFNR
jgi:hypothetical protein